MTINMVPKKKKIMHIGYTIILWVTPFLYLTLFPYLLNYTKYLARNEISFGPDASNLYQNLSVFILPIVFNAFIGAGVFILGTGIKNVNGKAIRIGYVLGVAYSFLILLSYPIYFSNSNLFLVTQILRLAIYTGPGNSSFILVFYGCLLYRFIKAEIRSKI